MKNLFFNPKLLTGIQTKLNIPEKKAEAFLRYFVWYHTYKLENDEIPSKERWNDFAEEKNQNIGDCKKRCPSASGCNSRFLGWNKFIEIMEDVLYDNKNVSFNRRKSHLFFTKKNSEKAVCGNSYQAAQLPLEESFNKLYAEIKTSYGRELTPEDWKKAIKLNNDKGKESY